MRVVSYKAMTYYSTGNYLNHPMQKWIYTQYLDSLFDPDMIFSELAESLWRYQWENNPVIQRYMGHLGKRRMNYLPISFFKAFDFKTGEDWLAEAIFESSGTTGQIPSRHFVRELKLYERIVLEGFFHFFPSGQYRILALLPSYLERENSSLVYMTKTWMDHFGLPGSGFYLYNFDALQQAVYEAMDAGEQILLIGVSFALLDFATQYPLRLSPNSIVIETGGMKGRREELTREKLHALLCEGLGIDHIYSEYGMTELMSQAYALKGGRFQTPPWMNVEITDIHLPFLRLPFGHTGRIQIVDLGNIHSCAFISTDDLGRKHEDGSFEVLGRIDQSELRGCSLMYE